MNDWHGTGKALPGEREYVQFITADEDAAHYGVFTGRSFHAHEEAFEPAQVRAWRKLGDAPQEPPPARTPPDARYWSERPMREA